jgi:hypothetical protein
MPRAGHGRLRGIRRVRLALRMLMQMQHMSLSASIVHALYAPPLVLECPVLHLLVHDELQRTVAHADQRKQRPAVEPAPAQNVAQNMSARAHTM